MGRAFSVTIALVLFSAGTRCNLSKEYSVEEPAGTTQSDATNVKEKLPGESQNKDVATENKFSKFWEQNNFLLRLRTTGGGFNKCTWFRRDNSNSSGVTLTVCTFFPNNGYGREYHTKFWELGDNDSMTLQDNGDITIKRLLYHHPEGTCGVVSYQVFMNADEAECDDNDYETNPDRCNGTRCTPVDKAEDEYLCKDNTHYELLVNAKRMTDVPEQCNTTYAKYIGKRRENKNDDLEGCTCICDKPTQYKGPQSSV
uniref:Lipocalin n=1 Tax=Rhipicephalus zambeziensis TaxID=60191 RepID=A0A224YMD1_9ACAR